MRCGQGDPLDDRRDARRLRHPEEARQEPGIPRALTLMPVGAGSECAVGPIGPPIGLLDVIGPNLRILGGKGRIVLSRRLAMARDRPIIIAFWGILTVGDAKLTLPERLTHYLRGSGIALALSDTSEDAPLILVNGAFCDLTGYTEEDVLHQNCRFLQGARTTEEMRRPLHQFVHGFGSDAGRFPILNYRKDGTAFHNYVFMSRLRNGEGEVKYILASQFDMTSALQRSKIKANDEQLHHALSDVDQIGREYGLAMMGSAKLLADSVAMMARLSLSDI